jgi:5'-nucleotidase
MARIQENEDQEEVIIPRAKEFEKKKAALIKAGAKNLHILADFDRTLTKAFIEGKKTDTVIAQIRNGHYLSEEYVKGSHALYDKYRPIEIDPKISLEEKKLKMLEWWQLHLGLICSSGMNREVMMDIINKDKIVLREGAKEFFLEANQKRIPILILSAALGDFIEELLKRENLFEKNLHVISNFFNFDAAGKVTGYKGNIIHTFNKNEAEISKSPHYKKILERKNIILLVDDLGDLGMLEGMKHENVLKIGFLNENIEAQRKEFEKNFDLIILNDGTMEKVNEILKEIN